MSVGYSQQAVTAKLIGQAQYDSLSSYDKSLSDSLVKAYPFPLSDTVQLNLLVDLSENCDEQDISFFSIPAIAAAELVLKSELAIKDTGFRKRVLVKKALALNNTGYYYWKQGNVNGGLIFLKLALKVREQINDQKGIAESLNNVGEMHRLQGNITEAVEYLTRSLKVREDLKDTAGIIISLNNLSLIFLGQGSMDKALENYQTALKLAEVKKDKKNLGYILHNIAYVYQNMKDTAKVLEYYEKATACFEAVNFKQGIALVLNNKGALLVGRKEYMIAKECFEKSLAIWQVLGDKHSITLSFVSLGNLSFNTGNYETALDYGQKAMKAAYETGYPENIRRSAQLLSKAYKGLGEFKKALEMHELFIQMRDSVFNEDTQKDTYKQQLKYEYEKEEALREAEHQKELDMAEEGKKFQRVVSWSVGGGLFMLLLFSGFIFHRLKVSREQKAIIEEQKRTVDRTNKHITDSIRYAKRIQDAILPSDEELSAAFSEHFIFFRPLDIVSGDFYWVSQQGNITCFAIADCTGHGVPGAFMSMIGNTLLNEIVNEQKISQPAEVLKHLNDGIVYALHQGSRSQHDGMDISFCRFDRSTSTLHFAGAHHSLYLVHENELTAFNGEKISLGSRMGQTLTSFSETSLRLKKGDTVYLASDGFQDQRGGNQGLKFTSRGFKTLLAELSPLPVKEQRSRLEKEFDDWKGARTQIDDVLVAGIKISG